MLLLIFLQTLRSPSTKRFAVTWILQLSLDEQRKLRACPRFIAKFIKSQSYCIKSFLEVGFGVLNLFTASDHDVWLDVLHPLAHPPTPME